METQDYQYLIRKNQTNRNKNVDFLIYNQSIKQQLSFLILNLMVVSLLVS